MILISLGSVFDWPNPYWRISFFASFHQWIWKATYNFQGPYPRRNGKTFFLSLWFPPIFYRGMIQGGSCELFFCDIVLDSKRGNRVYRIIDRAPWTEGRKSSWRTRRYNNNIVDAQQRRSPLPPACVASLSYQWFSYNEHNVQGQDWKCVWRQPSLARDAGKQGKDMEKFLNSLRFMVLSYIRSYKLVF